MSFPTEDEFLAFIAENPEDSVARLVYADWLEEQNDALMQQKAKFLRKQAEWQQLDKKSDRLYRIAEDIAKIAYTLPHDWCPKVILKGFPRHALPDPIRSPGSRCIIKTARTKAAINEAAQQGFKPLVLPVVRNEQISSWVAVYQDPETGLIATTGDHRYRPTGTLVVQARYYPYHFENPYAAYLVPAGLQPGEEVWLEDVIEDIVGTWGNQGHTYRLESAPARWNGTSFEILFDPNKDAPHWVG